jgi:hypothetical protein
MPSYIDRDKFMQELESDKYGFTSCAKVGAALDKAKADVVEVVRCKDCIHKVVTDKGKYNPYNIVCKFHESDGFDKNDFCSFGEKA